jgi:hypothetical protein
MSSRGLTRGVGGQSPESARFITFARGPAPEQGLNINAAVAAWQDRLGLWMLGPTEQVSSCWTRRVAATRPGAPTVAPSTSYTPADAGAMTCTQATTPTQVRSSLANSGGDGSTTQAGRTSRSHLHQPGPALPNQLVSRGGDFDSRYVKRCPDGHFAKASQWARQSRAAIRGEGGSRAGRDRRAASAVRGGAGPLVSSAARRLVPEAGLDLVLCGPDAHPAHRYRVRSSTINGGRLPRPWGCRPLT